MSLGVSLIKLMPLFQIFLLLSEFAKMMSSFILSRVSNMLHFDVLLNHNTEFGKRYEQFVSDLTAKVP